MTIKDGTGFGFQPFGKFPFGRSDFGRNNLERSVPDTYLEDDAEHGDRLRHFLELGRERLNFLYKNVENVGTLVDPNAIRDDILRYLGRNYGQEIDDAEPIEFARSLVNNAILLYQIKGTRDSYRVRGKISGFDVTVYNLYKFDPVYAPYLSVEDIFEIPSGSGRLYTDVAPGSVSGVPMDAGCGYCFTSFIKIEFLVVKSLPPAIGSENFFDRLISKLRTDVIPIHVRDVLYELRLIIEIDVRSGLKFQMQTTETQVHPCSLFYHFDSIPADAVPCDAHGYITGTVSV